jgi:uncharacterized protein (UPF0548 family)
MFLARRPSTADINRFLRESQELPVSYRPIGIVETPPGEGRFDEQVVSIGHGLGDFERARAALLVWKQFGVGWVETFPRQAPIEPGTNVAVLIRHLGFWSLNGCRVVYCVGGAKGESRFGFAYGTLPNHAEGGKELFEVFVERENGEVMYRIRAKSWPHAVLAHVGQPIVRALQARFRRDSAAAMIRAVKSSLS